MHIDHDSLTFKSEGDVEAKLIVPLITSELYLDIPGRHLFSKEYLAPTDLDKGAKVSGGYYPDFSVWMNGFPIMIVEAKAPGVPVEAAYREAALYARHLNSRYPAGFNPCNLIMATNGSLALFGKWDAEPDFKVNPKQLRPGSPELEAIRKSYGGDALRQYSLACLARVKLQNGRRPFNQAGGQAIINAKRPLNSFAADLSPILRRYFSSAAASDVREIARLAYVSSEEVTEYDRVLETLLKDRVQVRRDTIVEPLQTGRKSEANVAKAISNFDTDRPAEGQLQIIQGAVGAGKSLFIRRYKELLQPADLAARTNWAWIDFNTGAADLSAGQGWLCAAFIESFIKENPEIDFSSRAVLRGIFAKQIQRRKPVYDEVASWSEERAGVLRGEDLMKWQDDVFEYTRGLANHVLGQRNEVMVVVMDNVDRLDLKSQLDAFQLALWFMDQTKCFIMLQMRDETYERFKNKPPLDTFRSGIAFHISPPRFIDVVKKRLDLSLSFLATKADQAQTYTLPSGHRITVPISELGRFLQDLYVELFERRRNISRVLESLAGKDVRRALEMFVSIITSGHLGEDQITSHMRGAGGIRITEHNILKILMRTDYRFFSDHSGFISNIFHFENEWRKPSNFIVSELMFYLSINRKRVGQIGIEGYFTVKHLCEEMQKIGFDPDDCVAACNYLLQKYLVEADHMNNASVLVDDSIKISASGYIHLRLLLERIEYVYGLIPTTRITDEKVVAQFVDVIERESRLGDLSASAKTLAVEAFYKYLVSEARLVADGAGRIFDLESASGTAYVLRAIKRSIDRFRSPKADANFVDELD